MLQQQQQRWGFEVRVQNGCSNQFDPDRYSHSFGLTSEVLHNS